MYFSSFSKEDRLLLRSMSNLAVLLERRGHLEEVPLNTSECRLV